MNPQTLVFILVAPLLLNAVHAEVPNIFQTNTPALASEVNTNFSNLDMKIQNNQKKVSDMDVFNIDCDLDPNALISAVDSGQRNIFIQQGQCNGGVQINGDYKIDGAGQSAASILGNGAYYQALRVIAGTLFLSNVTVSGQAGGISALTAFGNSYVYMAEVDLFCNGAQLIANIHSSHVYVDYVNADALNCASGMFEVTNGSLLHLNSNNSFKNGSLNSALVEVTNNSVIQNRGTNNEIINNFSDGMSIILRRNSTGDLGDTIIAGHVQVQSKSTFDYSGANWLPDSFGEQNLILVDASASLSVAVPDRFVLNAYRRSQFQVNAPLAVNADLDMKQGSTLYLEGGPLDPSAGVRCNEDAADSTSCVFNSF